MDRNAVAVVGAAEARHGRCCIGEGGPEANGIGQLHDENFFEGEKETILGLESRIEGWGRNEYMHRKPQVLLLGQLDWFI